MLNKTKAKIISFGTTGLFLAPLLVSAQVSTGVSDVNTLLDFVTSLIRSLIPVLIALAVLLFIWGIVSFVTAGDDAEKRSAARNRIIWGVVFIFVMISVWGLVNILVNTFGLDTTTIPNSPDIPTP